MSPKDKPDKPPKPPKPPHGGGGGGTPPTNTETALAVGSALLGTGTTVLAIAQ